MLMTAPHELTDEDLVATIASLTGSAREATAALVAHLAELEARSLHLARGFRSLYGYCREVLHLSEHESYNRMEAAHAARRFPVILALLAEGRLHLTAVCLLAPRLTDENHLALIGGAIYKSKREVDELLARWFPKPGVAASVRRLPATAAGSPAAAVREAEAVAAQPDDGAASPGPVYAGGVSAGAVAGGAGSLVLTSPAAELSVSQPCRSIVAPLAADRYQIRFTASAATVEKLRRAQELLSHAVPSGDVGEIFDRALRALLEQAARRKHAATERPRPGRGIAPASRSVPAEVEREVWKRDGGRCAFVAMTGRRCAERRFVEFHHARPWAAGGLPTSENIELRCRAHNAYEAALYFGPIKAAMGLDAATRSGTSPAGENALR